LHCRQWIRNAHRTTDCLHQLHRDWIVLELLNAHTLAVESCKLSCCWGHLHGPRLRRRLMCCTGCSLRRLVDSLGDRGCRCTALHLRRWGISRTRRRTPASRASSRAATAGRAATTQGAPSADRRRVWDIQGASGTRRATTKAARTRARAADSL
jgi:hypothetical protein